MNKAKRESIIALLTKLGYEVNESLYSNRLSHYYSVKKDGLEIRMLLNNAIVHFYILENGSGKQVCAYGLVLASGSNIADGKQHESYKTLVDLTWEIRDLLNIQVPTIIL